MSAKHSDSQKYSIRTRIETCMQAMQHAPRYDSQKYSIRTRIETRNEARARQDIHDILRSIPLEQGLKLDPNNYIITVSVREFSEVFH